MHVSKTGDWAGMRKLLEAAPARFQEALRRGLLQEANVLRNDIVQGLTRQAPGGQAFAPLAPLTLAARKLKGIRGTKALIARADLRNAVAVVPGNGNEVFVGLPRKATSRAGQSLVDVAKVHEFGAGPIVIPMTPAMRRFLFVLLRTAGVAPHGGGHGGGGGSGTVVVRIPPHPFLRPAFKLFQQVAPERFAGRVARFVGWKEGDGKS